MSNKLILYQDPPPSPSSATCSLVHTTGGPVVSIQWSPSFTSQYDVEMYHVVVNPATPSCPSDQMIVSLFFICACALKLFFPVYERKGLLYWLPNYYDRVNTDIRLNNDDNENCLYVASLWGPYKLIIN